MGIYFALRACFPIFVGLEEFGLMIYNPPSLQPSPHPPLKLRMSKKALVAEESYGG